MGSTTPEPTYDSEPIAIIGLSRTECVVGDPQSRFNHKAVYHPDSEKLGTTHVKGAHFLEQDVGLFNAAFFNYSAETAAALDPQFRFQLESVYVALENELICQLGPLLLLILRGERAPLEIMMEGRLLYKYYANAYRLEPALEQLKSLLDAILHKNPRARFLEIGAGTGAAMRHALKILGTDEDGGPRCESWHFTDMSSGFFEASRAEFAAWDGLLESNKLDIDQGPEAQGSKLGSYHVVVACQVLHATKSMHRTMSTVRSLMKPGGTLLLMETTQD
ncbi:S-adenosyl-L-methionine-dependent methyltransferase [Aspergillus navahoensis]